MSMLGEKPNSSGETKIRSFGNSLMKQCSLQSETVNLSFHSQFECLVFNSFPGASAATILGKGFLAVRKAGHLCVATESQSYSDYTGREKTMEVRVDVLKPGQSIQVVCSHPHFVTQFWSAL